MVLDMAYRLGEIHRNSADDLERYKKIFSGSKSQLKDWKTSATTCVQIIRKSFSEIRAR
jgi:hypothetical protein